MQSHVDYIVQALIINTIFLKVFAPFEKSSILFFFLMNLSKRCKHFTHNFSERAISIQPLFNIVMLYTSVALLLLPL